jgi:predicted secreted protein
MKSAGASDEAMAFVKEFAAGDGLAYIRAFRSTGRVDIAYIEYLFRANELDGVLLVNGTPPIIDVDDYKFLSKEDLRKSADYATFLQKNPNANVFPAGRYHTEQPVESSSDNGRQSFEVDYLILDGCHACARIGTLLASFEFDGSGHFDGVRALKVRPGGETHADRPMLSRRPDERPPENAKEGKLDAREVRSKAGSSFTIVLAANHTTGYSWRLSKPLNANLLRQVSDVYEEESSGRIGAGGKETWTFEALSAGTAEIEFEYARPWGKDVAPVNTAKYTVEIK